VDGNGVLDAADIDLVDPLYCGPPGRRDVNEDGLLDLEDRRFWIHELKETWFGDANLDGEFNTTDLIQVFAGGKYETGETATWGEGDFTGDMKFDSSDLVAAFPHGWPKPPRPALASSTVPEPGAVMLLTLGIITAATTVWRR
jgi:hypothetical protein